VLPRSFPILLLEQGTNPEEPQAAEETDEPTENAAENATHHRAADAKLSAEQRTTYAEHDGGKQRK
jgi:hypothetical protein